MSSSPPLKVLVTGGAASFSVYLNKLRSLQTKHSFDLVIAFGLISSITEEETSQLLSSQLTIPLPLYLVGVGGVNTRRLEGINHLTLLELTSTITLTNGLKLATCCSDNTTTPSYSPCDILLSCLLPSALTTPTTPTTIPTSDLLNSIALQAQPRYHFIAGLDSLQSESSFSFSERPPFYWSSAAQQQPRTCRTITLAHMGNIKKDRWFYAFSIIPSSSSSTTAPIPTPIQGATPNPYLSAAASAPVSAQRGTKRPLGSEEEVNEYGVPNYIFAGQGQGQGQGQGGERKKGRGGPPDHYTCNICHTKGHWIQDCPQKEARDAERLAAAGAGGAKGMGNLKPISPDECWFCLSNPRVTKHLICSIGEEVYLTLPKGGLCLSPAEQEAHKEEDKSKWGKVPGGGHVLIIPIAHYPTLLSIPSSSSSSPILAEIKQYKQALRKLYRQYGCELVAWEVGRLGGKGGHGHLQVIPLPLALASPSALSAHFLAAARASGLTFHDSPTANEDLIARAAEQAGEHENYFRLELPPELEEGEGQEGEREGRTMVCTWGRGERFDLGFGRTTLASYLSTPERADWRACALQSDVEEKRDTEAFKKAFKEFDPAE